MVTTVVVAADVAGTRASTGEILAVRADVEDSTHAAADVVTEAAAATTSGAAAEVVLVVRVAAGLAGHGAVATAGQANARRPRRRAFSIWASTWTERFTSSSTAAGRASTFWVFS